MAEAASILARTARGAGWVIGWRVATRLLGVGSTLVTVRLLAPHDFGLVSLAYGFGAALEVMLALSAEEQIIRAKTSSRALYDTAFTLNALRGVLVTLAILAAAGPAARFFHEPRMEAALLALAFGPLLRGLYNVGAVEFRRALQFDKEFRLLLLPRLAGVGVTIAVAVFTRSHWALIAGVLTNTTAGLLASYAMHPYRPRLSLVAWPELSAISFWTWALGMVGLVRDWSSNVVLGRLLGPTQVGIFAVGSEVAMLPTSEVVDPLCRSCMPGFAEIDRAGSGVAAAYLDVIAFTAIMVLPMATGISLVAGPAIALAFGQNWLEAVPIVSLCSIAYGTTLFGNISGALLTAQCRLRTILGIGFAGCVVRAALLLLLVRTLGAWGAALAVAVSTLLEQGLLVACTMRALQLSPGGWLRRIWRPLAATTAMASTLYSAGIGWMPAPASTEVAAELLVLAASSGVVVYLAALGLLWFASGCPDGPEARLLAFAKRRLGLPGAAGTEA